MLNGYPVETSKIRYDRTLQREPSVGRSSGCKGRREHRFRNALTNDGKHRMGHAEVEVLNDLHVIAWNNNTDVAQTLHLSALKSSQADGDGPGVPGHFQRLQDVWRIPTATDGESYIAGSHEVLQLLGEDPLVATIVCPCRHERHVVGESHHTKALVAVVSDHRSFAQIAGKMRRQRGAPTVTEDENAFAIVVGAQ